LGDMYSKMSRYSKGYIVLPSIFITRAEF